VHEVAVCHGVVEQVPIQRTVFAKGKCLIAVFFPDLVKMLIFRCVPFAIGCKSICVNVDLLRNIRKCLSRHLLYVKKRPSKISEHAYMHGEAKPVIAPAPPLYDFKVML